MPMPSTSVRRRPTPQDRIVYNSATGQLFFDSNGNAAGGSTLFANLATGLALSNTDFNVV